MGKHFYLIYYILKEVNGNNIIEKIVNLDLVKDENVVMDFINMKVKI